MLQTMRTASSGRPLPSLAAARAFFLSQSRAQRHRLPQQGPRHAHYQQRAAPVLAAAEAEAAPETAVALPAVEHEQQRGGSNNGTQPSTSGRQADAVPTVRGAKVVVRDMVKHFKTPRGLFKAVNGASVAMEPGTITALLGPSGSGDGRHTQLPHLTQSWAQSVGRVANLKGRCLL